MFMLPAVDTRGRKISEEVQTIFHRKNELVEARFSTTRTYHHPDEAPSFARLRFHRGSWNGDIEIQEFAKNETDALKVLADQLVMLGFDEPQALVNVREALSAAPPPPAHEPKPLGDGKTKQQRSTRASNLGKFLGVKKAAPAPALEDAPPAAPVEDQ
jgi:hypothetical protein